jgi:hypothetical protein
MSSDNAKARSFEDRLRETLRAVRESDEAFDRWLRERGLDRESLESAAAGAGIEKSREMMEALEAFRRRVEEGIEELRKDEPGGKRAGEVLGMPGWAIKV